MSESKPGTLAPKCKKKMSDSGFFGKVTEGGLESITQADRTEFGEGATALVLLAGELQRQKALDAERQSREFQRRTKEERMQLFRDFTQFSFLVTHFLIEYGEDPAILGNFWKACEKVAAEADAADEFETLRKGVVAQVAVYHILRQVGKQPVLSHPDEDAFHAIDLWSAGDEVIQVKSGKSGEPDLRATEHIAVPAVQTADGQGVAQYAASSFADKKLQQFLVKVQEYERKIGRKLKGYTLVVPAEMIDRNTGKPKPALVAFFTKRFAALRGKK